MVEFCPLKSYAEALTSSTGVQTWPYFEIISADWIKLNIKSLGWAYASMTGVIIRR